MDLWLEEGVKMGETRGSALLVDELRSSQAQLRSRGSDDERLTARPSDVHSGCCSCVSRPDLNHFCCERKEKMK